MIEWCVPRPERLPLTGFALSLTTNLVWAAQVLYWPLVGATPTGELLAHRIVWSTLFCLGLALLLRRGHELVGLLRHRRTLLLLAGAAACLTTAWGVYIYAVNSARVVESSLGLFLIPLATALVGVVAFGERLRPWQWTAIAAAAVGTAVIAAGSGRPPWIAVVLCLLMAGYALLKKRANVPALTGFAAECLLATPLALAYLAGRAATGHVTVFDVDGWYVALLALSGLMTAVPLVAHAAAINLLPLAVVGVLQYLNPTIQFLIGVLVRHEAVTGTHWLGFGVIWCSLAAFVADSVRGDRRASPLSGAGLPGR
jgi:chloramphenicol-sensitive protein RarD